MMPLIFPAPHFQGEPLFAGNIFKLKKKLSSENPIPKRQKKKLKIHERGPRKNSREESLQRTAGNPRRSHINEVEEEGHDQCVETTVRG
jgi:hypothetical protein